MKTGELDKIGQDYLNKKNYKQAVLYFQKALKQEEHPAIRNNLALAHYMAGNPEKSLDTLSSNINLDAPPNPFSHSLAAQIFHKLGQDHEAGRQLDLAIKYFEDKVGAFSDSRRIPDAWGEYTVAIFHAAGALNEHRQVYELYRRWQNYHRHWESSYLAGVAAFNLKRYRQAANCWAELLQKDNIFAGIQRLALAVDQGQIPHFTLDYRLIDQDYILSLVNQANNSGAPEHFRQLANDSTIRLFYLALAIDEESPLDERTQYLRLLVRYGEKWGEQLGRSLLLSSTLHQDLKMNIMAALQEAGYVKAGEPLQMYADGEIRTVIYEQYDVSSGSAEEAAFDQAVMLVKRGQLKEAIQILEPPFAAGKFYVPAMLLLAHLNHQIGSIQKTDKILYMLQGIAHKTHDEKLMLNLVSFYLNIGDAFMARRQLEQIHSSQIPQELRQQILKRLSDLEIERLFQHEMDHYTDDMRHAIEDKILPINPRLARGLKNMPVEWINAACQIYNLQPARRRAEREKQLMLHLQEEEVMQYIVNNIEEDERKLLKYLLSHEGWSQTGPITRKFGSMEGDGFYWNADGPYSSLGQLWSMALVFVGRATINNRLTKIASIPIELRPLLTRLLPS
ncbi:MAG: tetratricopeptide repeat protein [Syntrophomonadaceae bacterium]|nr:tetratricopeptide repeat protein [Syntrophomonadaceae bacterium]